MASSQSMREKEVLRIGIIGAGAIGLYFGIRLAYAGHHVTFLIRSNSEIIRHKGLQLSLASGQIIEIKQPHVITSANAFEPQDWVLVALKTTQNAALADLLPPATGGSSSILTLQNGIGNVEAIRSVCQGNAVLAGLCQIGVNREAPGRVRSFVPDDGFIQIGQDCNDAEPDLRKTYAAVMENAGIRTRLTASLGEALWRKLMWNVPFNGLTVEAGGTGTDVVCNTPALRDRARKLMQEIRQAAEALGYPIEADYVDRLMDFTDRIGPYRTSSVLDWLAGRPLEVEAIFRKPLEAGRYVGVAMPELERLTNALDQCDHVS